MQTNLLIYDVGSTYTKLSAFFIEGADLQFLKRTQYHTTIDDIEIGLMKAKDLLIESGIKVDPHCVTLSTSSAAGGLRMVALGYMPRVTAKAAKEVAMSAGARVLEIVSHEDLPDYRLQVLREIRPDLILLAGGTDGGDQESLLENAEIIIKSGIRAVVILAGNKDIQVKVEELLRQNEVECLRVPNVMPTIHELNVKPAREAIHEQFIKQITRAKGLKNLLQIVSNSKVMPTPGAVLLGAELLAKGTFQLEGIGDVVVIDIGGATTDIHSVLPELDDLPPEEKGLIVSNEKQSSYRTVEGNLGLRVSATGIVDTIGTKGILAKVGKEGEEMENKLLDYTAFLEKNPDYISQSPLEKEFDTALAIGAIEVALKRHAGYISQEFNPVLGIIPGTPIGRDLRKVKTIIAVGGIFTHTTPEIQQFILKEALKNPGISLLPEKANYLVDNNYLLYAIGVLSSLHADAALIFSKSYFNLK